MIWHPLREGKDHINIYSKSSVKLGRALSNFFQSSFIHPDYGIFKSVEGFYYWLLTGEKHDKLRKLYGFPAKEYGESLEKTRKVDKVFKEEIQVAIAHKIEQNEYIKDLLLHSTLPFAHYYYYGEKENNPVVYDRSKRDDYLIEVCETIRIGMKKHGLFSKSKN